MITISNNIFPRIPFRHMKKAGILLLLISFSPTIAQSPTAYKVKAVFIFNFTRFVDWPETAFETENSPFVIGIAGSNPFGNYLRETVAGEKVGTHEIIIRNIENDKQVTNCHLLFIGYSDAVKVKELLNAIDNKSVLTVGEMPVFEKLGGMIRFYTEENKIRLIINSEAARLANLNVSSKLLSVAKLDSEK